MLDAKQVDTVVQELKREEAKRQEAEKGVVDPALAARLLQVRMDVERELGLERAPWGLELSSMGGLVEAGVAALVALLKA
jgi:hypothetical protein